MSERVGWVIYGLAEEGAGRVRYVGYSKNHNRRLRDHISAAATGKRRPVYDWIRSLAEKGKRPVMLILESGVGDGWKQAERRWISSFSGLFNLSAGGDLPYIPAESRKRAAEKLKSRVFTEEHKKRISAAKIGTKRPDNAARNKIISQGNFGKPMILSEAERIRRKEAALMLRGARWKNMTPEQRAQVSKAASEQMKRVWAERRSANV